MKIPQPNEHAHNWKWFQCVVHEINGIDQHNRKYGRAKERQRKITKPIRNFKLNTQSIDGVFRRV